MFNLESYISSEFARAFGVAEEQAFCTGTGVGQTTGIFTDNGGEMGITFNSITNITCDNIIDLVHSLIYIFYHLCFVNEKLIFGI